MKTFKPFMILGCGWIVFSPFCVAEGGSAWSPGVSLSEGWIDENKAHVPYSGEDAWEVGNGNISSRTDASMCWAAQSANMLQYWQNAYVAAGNKLSDGTPNGFVAGRENKTRRRYQVFEHFVGSWTDAGGDAEYGISWYLTGEFFSAYPTDSKWSECFGGMETGGFFKNVYSSAAALRERDFKTFDFSGSNSASGFSNLSGFSSLLVDCLQKESVIGLNIYAPLESGGTVKHALTLWGCEYDANKIVTKVYFTDSDDGATRLIASALSEDSSGVYLSDYSTNGNARIQDFSMLSVQGISLIPEPAAFAWLAGTLALGLVFTRRRRN